MLTRLPRRKRNWQRPTSASRSGRSRRCRRPRSSKSRWKKAPEEQKKPRQKGDPRQNRVQRRERPTRIMEHHISTCEQCGSRLGGVSVAGRGRVIQVAPPPVEVTEHGVYHGWWSHCRSGVIYQMKSPFGGGYGSKSVKMSSSRCEGLSRRVGCIIER
jgi:hypothetical protein